MTEKEQKKAARLFAEEWADRGNEKQETQRFWIQLLQNVFGIDDATNYIEFEKPVELEHTSYIDAYIKSAKILIEQKSADVDLHRKYKQSDGNYLTPFLQAKRYADELPNSLRPHWIIVCNFQEFLVHDLENPHKEPVQIFLKDFEKDYYRLSFLEGEKTVHLQKENELSFKSGELIGEIYDKLRLLYGNAETDLKHLNRLCVRIVFCLFAEDAGIFGKKSMFGDYLNKFKAEDLRDAMLNLFRILDLPEEKRSKYEKTELLAFPYVNGGLFSEAKLDEIPQLTDEIKQLLVEKASANFDWSEISPTIFGSLFESTLNPETRRGGGMHYTSIENIHKVIDPLFLDRLNTKFVEILKNKKNVNKNLEDLRDEISKIQILDPACGSGNFLTETYLSLRRLENKILKNKSEENLYLDKGGIIKVNINQFYGIEINDFAVSVAKTALWIAECQMLHETEDIIEQTIDFLPLKSNANIVEGNALRIDWNTVCPANKLSYIIGNPPFVGQKLQTEEQKADLANVFGHKHKGLKMLDYVAGWYKKSMEFMRNTDIRTALVSTNSICQGESIEDLWSMLFNEGVHIDFAFRTFRWDNGSKGEAHVHCIIVGFSMTDGQKEKIIYDGKTVIKAKNINGYLIDNQNITIARQGKQISGYYDMTKGAQLIDGGGFMLNSDKEKSDFLRKYPEAKPYVYRYYNAQNLLNNLPAKYCLYLKYCPPNLLKNCKGIRNRVQAVYDFRANNESATTRVLKDTPSLFFQSQVPEHQSIVIPVVSSGSRKYIPMCFMPAGNVYTNALFYIDNADLYLFGILMSNVHMAWTNIVGGRLKSDFRYSNDIVYNNFPFPKATKKQEIEIMQTAQAILTTREKFHSSSLADLYDKITMPLELRKAHAANDRAVMEAYGFTEGMSDEAIVGELFKLYEKLTTKPSKAKTTSKSKDTKKSNTKKSRK